MRIGAAVTYAELAAPPLAGLVPALAQAARTVGSPQIRNGDDRGQRRHLFTGGRRPAGARGIEATVELVSGDGCASCRSVR